MAREIFNEEWNDLTEEEIKSKIKWVRNQIYRQGYKHRQDKERKNFESVRKHLEENPDATPTEIASAIGLSRPSVYKFMAMGDTYFPSVGKNPAIKHVPLLSVCDKLCSALRGIIHTHLDGAKTFECDLTFGEGGFYKAGIEVPDHIFDKFDFGKNGATEKVKELNADNLKNIKVSSVIIDLPIKIGGKETDIESFNSVADLYEAYVEYIEYADRLLKKGGILIFSTADFILKEEDNETGTPEIWATDYAISTALSKGFELKDKVHMVRKGGVINIGDLPIKTGVKDSTFLIFVKRR